MSELEIVEEENVTVRVDPDGTPLLLLLLVILLLLVVSPCFALSFSSLILFCSFSLDRMLPLPSAVWRCMGGGGEAESEMLAAGEREEPILTVVDEVIRGDVLIEILVSFDPPLSNNDVEVILVALPTGSVLTPL